MSILTQLAISLSVLLVCSGEAQAIFFPSMLPLLEGRVETGFGIVEEDVIAEDALEAV